MDTIHYSYGNQGTAAFPSYAVRRDVWDADGFDLEHLSEEVGPRYMTEAQAKAACEALEAATLVTA